MKFKPRLSITMRFIVYQVIGLTLVLGVIGWFQFQIVQNGLKYQIETSGENLLRIFEIVLSQHNDLLTENNLQPIVLELVAKNPNIQQISVVDSSLQIIADSNLNQVGKKTDNQLLINSITDKSKKTTYDNIKTIYHLTQPIQSLDDLEKQNNVIGAIAIDIKVSPANQKIIQDLTQIMVSILGVIIIYAILFYLLIYLTIINPLTKLTIATEKMSSGNLNISLPPPSGDEIGKLTISFSNMSHHLQQILQNLENQVSERNRDLALTAEISHRISTIGNLKYLLIEAVNTIQSRFNIYNVQIYLLDSNNNYLVLQASTNTSNKELIQSGQILKLNIDSIITTAITEKRVVIATDNNHRNLNPSAFRLPETRSEMAVPLILDQVLGILNLQDKNPNTFTMQNIQIFETLASQLAIAIENTRLYESAQREINERKLTEEKLQKAREESEKRVTERTIELSNTNKRLKQEIIDREQTEEELQKAKEGAEAANKAKSQFLANMSHELRTPLNAILGFSQLMSRNQNIIAEDRENLKVINRSGEHLLALLNDILEMSKIEAGRSTINQTNFNLYRLLDDLENMFRLKAAEKKLYFIFDRTTDVPQYVRTDEQKLRQILINLLGNAIKFTQRGSVVLRVSTLPKITPVTQNNESISNNYQLIHFEIEDTGPGIASTEMDLLFEAFGQTKSGKQTQEGSGLGLPISYEFVKMLGGEITVSSHVGQGSNFKFDIRVRIISKEDIENKQPTKRVVGLEPDQPQYKILIVEDKWANRKLLVKLFEPLGFEVKEATNGQEGIEIWETWKPHLIWMDMRMPIMDGYEATKRIKSTSLGLATIIIALTASVLEDAQSVILSIGCDDIMYKPIDEAELFDKMAQHLGVRYIYEDQTPLYEAEDESDAPESIPASIIYALPAKWLANLELATTRLDLDIILNLAEEVRPHDNHLSNVLANWANNFEYNKIGTLIQLTKEQL